MSMFCFQCEQTVKGQACTGSAGVCGKKDITAGWQDSLTSKLVELAQWVTKAGSDDATDKLVMECLFSTVTNVNFNDETLNAWCQKVDNATQSVKSKAGSDCSCEQTFAINQVWQDEETIRSLKSLILLGIRGISAYAHHALALGYKNQEVFDFFYKALNAIATKNSVDELLPLVMETGTINYKVMELLDKANTETYGDPVPTPVTTTIEKGPFIVVTGHDLLDLYLLLKQTEGKGINIYTHSEMLPAHAYPKLKEFPHLKGNFGTAWQNQQSEFNDLPGAVLYTTNCLMPPKVTYSDRIYTTGVVSFPNVSHIDDNKDFSPVIAKALALGGYQADKAMPGINGGSVLTTGFARKTVLSVAGTVIDAVKSGAIKHFFLVGGCDGAKPGRNYYTEFVKKTPKDSIILTLACGKYRFNDLDLGEIGGLPRILDMGQCNDAYSAIQVALALADAFECGVNDLPLTLVLSWYEQKAVSILLTLLSLGIKNIYIGPSLPAFVSPAVLDILVKEFGLTPISSPDEDLAKMLGN